MMMEEGWILLHRKLLVSSCWGISKECSLFLIHSLFKANFKDGKWFDKTQGKEIVIRRGQFVSSREHLAKEFKMTQSKIRTCLKHLEKAGFLTKQITSQYSIITIVNYDKYQTIPERIANEIAKPSPSLSQGLATIEESNKGKEDIFPSEVSGKEETDINYLMRIWAEKNTAIGKDIWINRNARETAKQNIEVFLSRGMSRETISQMIWKCTKANCLPWEIEKHQPQKSGKELADDMVRDMMARSSKDWGKKHE